jgi:Cu2+-exporting ATPase
MGHSGHHHEHDQHEAAQTGTAEHHEMPPQAQTHQHPEHDHSMVTMDHAGHGGAHADHTGHEQMFRQRFWRCLLLTIPVLLYSPMIQT